MKAARFVILSALLATFLAGCSSTSTVERADRSTLPYEVRVRPVDEARITSDGFEARFIFDVISPHDLQRNSLVQELRQTMTLEYANGSTRKRGITLVEAFRLRLVNVDSLGRHHYQIYVGQSDRHAMRGMEELPRDVVSVMIDREVFAYVANVDGADFTPGGFAQLPHNEDRTVVSRVPDKFNRDYQSDHDTRGWVMHSGDSLGLTYRIQYSLKRTDDGGMNFVVDRTRGFGVVEPPSVIQTD